MSNYGKTLRKTVKWYRKIAIEILFGTAVVNAHFLYKKITDSIMTITEFSEKLIEELLHPKIEIEPRANEVPKRKRKDAHIFF